MKNLTIQMNEQFVKMCQTGNLFRSIISGDTLVNVYLNSFEHSIFRDPNSSTHNCNNCKNFIRNYGNIVAIDENMNIMTIWDVNASEKYSKACSNISNLLKSNTISEVFVETYDYLNSTNYEKCNRHNNIFKLGISQNFKQYTKGEVKKFGIVEENKVYTFHHLYLNIPSQFIYTGNNSKDSIKSEYRTNIQLLKKGLDNISINTLELVLELINQNSILNGLSYKENIKKFLELKINYEKSINKEFYIFLNFKSTVCNFANTLIGVLCLDIEKNIPLEKACSDWNKRVDPINYKRASAPISKKQIEEAEKFVIENGYEESFNRRFATLDDIKAHEILHMNVDTKQSNVSIFNNIKPTNSKSEKLPDNIKEIKINEFMETILPSCSLIEAYITNNHKNNFTTLTTSCNTDSKNIFSWNNNFSWTYNGNIAGKSFIKEEVKKAGGNINSRLRFSIMWNEDGKSIVDFDAYCIVNRGYIDFSHKYDHYLQGRLDVDMINPSGIGVENIYFQSRLRDGLYQFKINNYNRKTNNGFKAELEVDGQVFEYSFNKEFQGKMTVVEVLIRDNQIISIDHKLNHSESSIKIYNIDSNTFVPVNLICKSPNYWDDNKVGNLHYFFMLKDCKTNEKIKSFHNENLKHDLSKHRKVMEVLTNSTMIEPSDNQLSGLGFNATVKDELIVKVTINNKLNFYKIIF